MENLNEKLNDIKADLEKTFSGGSVIFETVKTQTVNTIDLIIDGKKTIEQVVEMLEEKAGTSEMTSYQMILGRCKNQLQKLIKPVEMSIRQNGESVPFNKALRYQSSTYRLY